MACDNLSLGRLKPCKDSVGGLKAVYFINYGDIPVITFDSTDTDVIDSIGTSVSAYKYDVHFMSSLTQNVQASLENGTVAYEQSLELSLPKLSKEDNKELKLLAHGSPHVVVEDQNGNYFLAGAVNGMDVSAGTIVTGTALGDMSGYTLTLTGMERQPANFLVSDITTAGGTIVEGV
tara:strand:- start:16592 stop:17122 length:531 start_codon:yes stop_codon:yes gene_type:complete